MSAPAKSRAPAKEGRTGGLGRIVLPLLLWKQASRGEWGALGYEAMGIRMGWISLLHSLWSTQNSSSLTQIV